MYPLRNLNVSQISSYVMAVVKLCDCQIFYSLRNSVYFVRIQEIEDISDFRKTAIKSPHMFVHAGQQGPW